MYILKPLTLLFFLLYSNVGVLYSQDLKISENSKYFIDSDGNPFFWLGDTAWELFHRLDRDEADRYLEDRASKGFTVIQTVILAELDGLNEANAYGELPLKNNFPATPNDKYFDHVDYIINKANSLGIFVGLLPTWGDKFNIKWGKGPEIFTPENARRYGEYLGKRYRNKNIIWILGGDRNPEDENDYAIIRAMAAGLEIEHKGRQLMTYHPQGGSNSAVLFPDAPWLDFHFFQSGHGARNAANYLYNRKNLSIKPLKPTLDGEPRYEDHPVAWKPDSLGWFDDFDIRQAAYWSMLSGAAGHTYGNHNVWQMWEEGLEPVSWARTNWNEAIYQDGATQMGYMKKLLEARSWFELVPDQSLIRNVNKEGATYQMAAISNDRSFALIYTPFGKTISVDLNRISGKTIKAWWYNPRDGRILTIGEFSDKKNMDFIPHATGRGSDWVLVLENKEKNLPMPN